MCECTPKSVLRYCGQPGCRDPLAIEVERLRDAMAHAVKELEELDDETAQAQAKALREVLGDIRQ